MNILLMEPDRILANSYTAALGHAGHKVFWQHQAQPALAILEQHSIDLIILEIQLAQHNGVEFLHEVRSYPEWDNIPVLLHTMLPRSNAGLGRAYWPQLGIVEHLYKPQTSLTQLIAAVANLSSTTNPNPATSLGTTAA